MRKISETFLDFATPILRSTGERATEEDIDQILRVAFTIWNGVVYDKVNGNNHYVQQIRELTSRDPFSRSLADQLINRKLKLFADDDRLVGEYKITYKDGELHMRAEARVP